MDFSFSWKTNQNRIRTEIITKQYPYIPDVFREIITNSIDAEATNIEVEIYKNLIGGISKVIISDNGLGMTKDVVLNIFSQIATDNKAKNPNQIGQFGIGRFSVYTLGSLISWETRAKIEKDKVSIIKFTLDSSGQEKVACSYTEEQNIQAGTTIIIEQIHQDKYYGLSKYGTLKNSLSTTFAALLLSKKDIKIKLSMYATKIENNEEIIYEEKSELITFDNLVVDTEKEQISTSKISGELKHIILDKTVSLEKSSQIIFSEKDITVQKEFLNNIEIPEHKYIAIATSNKFTTDLSRNRIIGLDTDFNEFKQCCINACENFANKKSKELNVPFITLAAQMEGYPARFKKTDLNEYEKINKMVYDKCLTVINEKVNFISQSEKIKNIIFSFLDKALCDNNFISLLQKLIGLSAKEVQELDKILGTLKFEEFSKLYNSTIGRLEFLNSFESLVYDYKEYNVAERTQLQKIIEDNLWLFKEEFNIAYFDTRISNILKSEGYNSEIQSRDLLPDFLLGYKKYDEINKNEHILLIEIKKPGVPIELSHKEKLIDRFDELTRSGRFPNTCWYLYLISDKIQNKFSERSITDQYNIQISDTQKSKGMVEFKALTWSQIIDIKKQELYFIQKEISKDFPYDANYIKEQYTELFGNQTS